MRSDGAFAQEAVEIGSFADIECQALVCDPGDSPPAVAALHAAVRELVPTLTVDRPPADDLAAVLALVQRGAVSPSQ